MKRFENQSAIITGGAEGLGRGIAERIASEGGKVFLLDINQPMLEKTIQDFKNKGFDAEGFAGGCFIRIFCSGWYTAG